MAGAQSREGHTKVLSGTKKERNQWVFCVVKGILGQRYYESDYWPDLVPIYWLYKRPQQILVETNKVFSELHLLASCTAVADLLAIVNRLDSTWQLVHHRAFDEVFACARTVCDSASTYLVVCRFDHSTN